MKESMTVGEFLHLAQQIYEARPPLDAPLLLLDKACEEGAEPLVIVEPHDCTLTHLSRDVLKGAVIFFVERRSLIEVSSDGGVH